MWVLVFLVVEVTVEIVKVAVPIILIAKVLVLSVVVVWLGDDANEAVICANTAARVFMV